MQALCKILSGNVILASKVIMDYELVFSLSGLLAMSGWGTLLFSPLMPHWSDRIAGLIVPVVLSAGYLVILLFFPMQNGGGFGSFAEVTQLFSNPEALMGGWIHYLAFDLFVGAWICRTGRHEGIKFWLVLPSLPVTFMLGPAGFLLFSTLRIFMRSKNLKTQ